MKYSQLAVLALCMASGVLASDLTENKISHGKEFEIAYSEQGYLIRTDSTQYISSSSPTPLEALQAIQVAKTLLRAEVCAIGGHPEGCTLQWFAVNHIEGYVTGLLANVTVNGEPVTLTQIQEYLQTK
jgi:hypothetical protein